MSRLPLAGAETGTRPNLELVPEWTGVAGDPDEPRYVVRREHFGALVYDRDTLQYVPYDEDAAQLILSRAGEAGQPLAELAPDAQGFLAVLRQEGLLDDDHRLRARVVADKRHPERLSAPLSVYLGATQGCNLACGHCQSSSAPGPLGALPLSTMLKLWDDMRALGCGLVSISGGEPLLHPEFFPAVDAAFARGLNVLLTTNATLIDERLAEALAVRPFRCLSVSLDGGSPARHDAVRGPGAFERALRGLELLAARRPVGVTAVLTRELVGGLPELLEACQSAGAASISLRPALPAGRALERRDLLASSEEWSAALGELDRLQEEAAIPLFHPPEVPHQFDSAAILEGFGCVAANLVCSVTPQGQLSPCSLLGPNFDSGDLAEHGLEALWAEGSGFRRLRRLEGNEDCWSCRHYDTCGGGCRARALADTGDLEAPDSWCHYEPLEPGPPGVGGAA